MKPLKITWLVSLVLAVLMVFDQIAGVETEDANGTVVAVSGYITGEYCWPILFASIAVCAITSLAILGVVLKRTLSHRRPMS